MKINLIKTRKTEGAQRRLGFTLLGVFAAVSASELSASETKTFLIPHSPKVAWFYVDENNDFWIRLIDASWIRVPQTELFRTENTLLISTKFLKQNAPDLVPKSFVDGEVALGSYYQDLGEDEGLNIVANVSGISSITLINTNTLEVLKDNGAQIIIQGRHFNFSDGYLTVNLNFLEKYATDLIPSGKNFPDNVYLGHYDETSPYKLTGKQSVEYNFTDRSTHYKGGGFEIVLDNGKVILVPEYAVVSATSGVIQINKNWVIENSQHPEVFWNPDTESYQTAGLGASGGSEDTSAFSIWGILGGLGLLGGAAGSLTASNNSSSQSAVVSTFNSSFENATVFIDTNGDGEFNIGELSSKTNADGIATFNIDTSTQTVFLFTDQTTTDVISGEVISGQTLTAPQGASVISPLTALLAYTSLTEGKVKTAFTLPETYSLLEDNPLDDAWANTDRNSVVSANYQLIATSKSYASALTGAGIETSEAFMQSFSGLYNVIESQLDNNFSISFLDTIFLTTVYERIISENNYSTEIENALLALQPKVVNATKNLNQQFSLASLNSSENIENELSIINLVPEQISLAATSEINTPGSGSALISYDLEENLAAQVPSERAIFSVIAFDLSDPENIEFIGNEDLKISSTEAISLFYSYGENVESGMEGFSAVTFSGDTSPIDVEFRDQNISLFDGSFDVLMNRSILPDGSFSDYLTAHVYDESEVQEYLGSFMWLLGGESIPITNQQEFDANMAASATYVVDFIPNDVAYGPGQDDWLIALDII
jgi:hypothetical protein